jgi:hypothetical protein
MINENSKEEVVDSNATMVLERLADELQYGLQTHKIEDPILMLYFDCKGCGKYD